MKSWTKPTDKEIEAVLPSLASSQHEAYFFGRLNNPLWIEGLDAHKAFNYPPKTESLPNGAERYPIWPASRYLARMAAEQPSVVARVFSKIETDNPSVIGDMLAAALQMPGQTAALVSSRIVKAARDAKLWVHFGEAADLCVHLAKASQWKAGFTLLEALFGHEQPSQKPSQRDEYWDAEALKRIVPVYAEGQPEPFIRDMCRWLTTAITNSVGDATDLNDRSWVWRPAIEEHEQNHGHSLRTTLTGFLRQACETAVNKAGMPLSAVVDVLRSQRFIVFERLALYLIATLAAPGDVLATEVLRDRAAFDDHRLKHEYVELTQRHFSRLGGVDSERWLGWVDAGPDMAWLEKSIQQQHSRQPSPEERQNFADWWRFNKLYAIRDHLTGDHAAFYASMLAKHGEPLFASMNVHSSSQQGHESPMTVEQLKLMGFRSAVSAVSEWKPVAREDFWGPSLDGLADVFRQYTAEDVTGVSSEASAMIEAAPVFVRAYLSPMTQAIKDGRQIDLEAVLGLCNWVVSQPLDARLSIDHERHPLVDSDWQWCREECARLCEAICKAERDGQPAYNGSVLRTQMWQVLDRVNRDAANSYLVADPIADSDPVTKDFISIALNSSRGMALGAALEYARWVARQVAVREGNREIVPGGFNQMPEIREMLEWHINNKTVQSFACIGLRIVLLHWIDQNWVLANAARVFDIAPVPGAGSQAGWAAWNSFIVGTQPHVVLYMAFRGQFETAIRQAAIPRPPQAGDTLPLFHLAEYLSLLYGRGDLQAESDAALFQQFVKSSQPAIRRHAITFVGESLRGDGAIPPAVIERFQSLWDVYWDSHGVDDAKACPNAYLFGLWFATGRFEASWALARLDAFSAVVGLPEPDHAVVERLAAMAEKDPQRIIRLLKRMIESDTEGWHVHGWAASAREILRIALSAGGEAQSIARDTISALGRRGFHEFGKLLKE